MQRRHFLQNLFILATLASCKQLFESPRKNRTLAPRKPNQEDLEDSPEGKEQLIADPDGLVDLPKNYSYKILQYPNTIMTDGFTVPPNPCAMACLSHPDGSLILIRNHTANHPNNISKIDKDLLYDDDYAANGCVTRLLLDSKDAAPLESQLLLAGLKSNDGGGVTPWGWLSAEKSMAPTNHGYVFLNSISATKLIDPTTIRLDNLGRFEHGCMAFQASTHNLYMTQDTSFGLLYRFSPSNLIRPFDGKTYALKVKNFHSMSMERASTVGEQWAIEWVDDDQGPTTFSNAWGIYAGLKSIYFCCSYGGNENMGQIFAIHQDKTLELVAVSNTERMPLLRPRNLLADSSMKNIYFTQNLGSGASVKVFNIESKKLTTLASCQREYEFFSGLCFSPDERYLFVNMHQSGQTLAIRGSFKIA